MNLKVNENEVRLTYADGKTQTATHFAWILICMVTAQLLLRHNIISRCSG